MARGRSTLLLAFFAAALLPTSLGQDAPITDSNPEGAQYIAVLPNGAPGSGSVVASSSPNGTGVTIQVSISNLPSQGGPFEYTIHVNPVPSSGSCASTGSILNPYHAGTSCNAASPDKCRVGDLSGKQDPMPGPNFAASYVDLYLSTTVGSPVFVGDKSLVISASNGTIVTCANFSMDPPSQPPSSAGSAGTPSVLTTRTGETPPKDKDAPAGPPPGPGGNSVPPKDSTPVGPPPGPGGNFGRSSLAAVAPKDKGTPAAAPATMTDGCNTTTPAAAPAAPPPLTTTPGVIPGFTPSLNGAAGTITKTITSNMTGTSGPCSTLTQLSNNTVTVVIQVPQNSTTTSSTPTPSPVCGTGIATTLPNGSIVTVLIGPSGAPNTTHATNGTNYSPSNSTNYSLKTILGGPSGTTTTLPGSSMTIWGMTMARPGWRSIITVPPNQATVLTITQTGPMSSSYSPPSSIIITVPPSSSTIVTISASTTPDRSTPIVQSVLQILGPVTTELPAITSMVKVPAGVTSLVTLPTVDPGLDVMTLLGGVTGLTTEIPAVTPTLPDLDPLDLTGPPPLLETSIIEPPDLASALPTPLDLGDAARPTVGVAAVIIGAVGLVLVL